MLGAAGERDGVIAFEQLRGGHVLADMDPAMEGHALRLHLLDAALDVALLQLEVGDAVAQQAAGLRVLLVEMHVMADAGELLRAGEARRAGADDGDALAGLRGSAAPA